MDLDVLLRLDEVFYSTIAMISICMFTYENQIIRFVAWAS